MAKAKLEAKKAARAEHGLDRRSDEGVGEGGGHRLLQERRGGLGHRRRGSAAGRMRRGGAAGYEEKVGRQLASLAIR